jgi:CRP/FNR family cyclic AMP-dependent transcriptional regulator
MTRKPGLTTDLLRSIPLFRGISDEQLTELVGLFEAIDVPQGDVLFDVGDHAKTLYLLEEGEVTLYQSDEETHRLCGPVVIGELGAMTGLERNSRAVVGPQAALFQVTGQRLHEFFAENSAIGLRFKQNMLEVAGDKIDRDQTRLIDMRGNLIRTQKAMKKMRDLLLESDDTEISEPLHSMIEQQIRQNRRVNYRVEPPAALSSTLRLAEEQPAKPVVEISRTHLSFREQGASYEAGARMSGVLTLSGPELPISGRVLRTIGNRVDIELDLLIDEYARILESYLTRIQMLDFLV